MQRYDSVGIRWSANTITSAIKGDKSAKKDLLSVSSRDLGSSRRERHDRLIKMCRLTVETDDIEAVGKQPETEDPITKIGDGDYGMTVQFLNVGDFFGKISFMGIR